MSSFLGEYFHQSLNYLDNLRSRNPVATAMLPMSWVKNWLDSFSPMAGDETATDPTPESTGLADRMKQLEERLAQLESEKHDSTNP